jgi:hypothetical protein
MRRCRASAGEPDDRGRGITAIWIADAGSCQWRGRQRGTAPGADHRDILDRQRLGHHPAVLEHEEEREEREGREGQEERREEERRQAREKVQSELTGNVKASLASTLYKIANALDLSEKEIALEWTR